jgi:hypothetical protein
LAANVVRIVVTALAYAAASSHLDRKLVHDIAGWAMIPLAAVLIAGVHWYLSKLVLQPKLLGISDLVDRQRGRETTPLGQRGVNSSWT